MAIAAGISNDLYWQLTAQEVSAVLDRLYEEEKRATLRAALVAATIVNVNRKKGARLVHPSDFIRELPKPEDYMSVDAARALMDRWAASQNEIMPSVEEAQS